MVRLIGLGVVILTLLLVGRWLVSEAVVPWEVDWSNRGSAVSAAPTQAAGLKPWEVDWNTSTAREAMPWEIDWGVARQGLKPSDRFDMDTYLTGKMGVESSGGKQLSNSSTTAAGQFQFTATTWKETVKKMGKDWTLEDRFDEEKSREAAEFYVRPMLTKYTEVLGRLPAYHELYTAHFLGNTGGLKFIQAPKHAVATEYVSKTAARNNRPIFFKEDGKPRTVGEVLDVLKNRFDRWIK
jgi:hypothetical protein